MQIMKENRLKTYCAPECTLVHVETSSLMETSFPSQHNPAHPGTGPNSGISFPGQHEPGHHGHGPSGAKQGLLWEDEEDEEDGFSSWGE